MRPILVLVCVLTVFSVHCAEFPKRFSATVVANSTWGKYLGCAGLPIVGQVYQDLSLNSSLWSHYVETVDLHHNHQEVLYIVPSSTADPDTPEATQLTRFLWTSDTKFKGCSYGLSFNSGLQVPEFFRYPLSVLESKEVVNGVECEKWSNRDKAGPYDSYWAVWFPVNTHPPHSVVLQAQYNYPPSRPGQFPVPGCTITYTFSNFNTDPIPKEKFIPPDNWLKTCTDSDEGLKKYSLPDRQDGYKCVTPTKNSSFSISLFTKPVREVVVEIRLCKYPDDSCIDGAHCKDCVKFSPSKLIFEPSNWSVPQTVEISYDSEDGDSQFRFDSPYYLNNTYDTQFSTCACASGKCSNECQMFCR